MLENSLFPMEKRVNGGLNTGVNKMLEDLEGYIQQRDELIALWISLRLT